MTAGKRVRALRPFKKRFIASTTDGSVQAHQYRCPYYVFAYRSNLGLKNWSQNEYERIKNAASQSGCALDIIDRVFVFDRGIIHPNAATASDGTSFGGGVSRLLPPPHQLPNTGKEAPASYRLDRVHVAYKMGPADLVALEMEFLDNLCSYDNPISRSPEQAPRRQRKTSARGDEGRAANAMHVAGLNGVSRSWRRDWTNSTVAPRWRTPGWPALLLTEFQSNTVRIEMLAHLMALRCKGKIRSAGAQIREWLNESCGMIFRHQEDPPEDVFVGNVVTGIGNSRLFEGIWERTRLRPELHVRGYGRASAMVSTGPITACGRRAPSCR